MKECPSCGTMVPRSAERCKDCFHDFSEVASTSNGGPIFLLAAVAAMAVVLAGVLWFVTGTATEEHILVDQQTESVVWTRQYRWGAETERLKWSEVAKLEYVVRSGGYEVAAIAMNGDRFVIHEAVAPLKTTADQYAAMMEKPLDIVDQTRGFHKMD